MLILYMEIQLKKFDINDITEENVVVLIGKRDTGKSILCKDILYHHQNIPVGQVISGTEGANQFYSKIVPPLFIHEEYSPEIIANALKRQKIVVKKNYINVIPQQPELGSLFEFNRELSLTFEWEEIGKDGNLNFQLSTDQDFKNLVKQISRPKSPLFLEVMEEGKYFWRIVNLESQKNPAFVFEFFIKQKNFPALNWDRAVTKRSYELTFKRLSDFIRLFQMQFAFFEFVLLLFVDLNKYEIITNHGFCCQFQSRVRFFPTVWVMSLKFQGKSGQEHPPCGQCLGLTRTDAAASDDAR